MAHTKTDRLSWSAERLRQSLGEDVPGREREWTETVRAALIGVKKAFQDHTVAAEAPDGLLVSVNRLAPATLPTVSRRVDCLRQEHVNLSKQVTDLESQVQNALQAFKSQDKPGQATDPFVSTPPSGAVPEFGTIRQIGEKLLETLQQHQRAESLLVLDTVNTDIGVGD
jgi:hypothetical protein